MNRTVALLFLPVLAGLACNSALQDMDSGPQRLVLTLAVPTSQPAANDPDAKVRTRMKTLLIPKFDVSGLPVSEVVQFLRDLSNLDIYVQWDALRRVAIDKNNPVNNVKLTDVTFDKALRTVLEDVGGVNPLGYIIKDGVITISTRDDLSRHTTMRIYDVRDLISLDPLSGQDEVGGIDPLNTVTDMTS